MKSKIHAIRDFMTWTPLTVGHDIPVGTAKEMMRDSKIRHLPVLDRGKIVGVISDRDITEAMLTKGGDRFLVEDVMMPSPYAVGRDTPLREVVSQMADEKYGCAIIEDKAENAIGIFTTVDACRALARLFRE